MIKDKNLAISKMLCADIFKHYYPDEFVFSENYWFIFNEFGKYIKLTNNQFKFMFQDKIRFMTDDLLSKMKDKLEI